SSRCRSRPASTPHVCWATSSATGTPRSCSACSSQPSPTVRQGFTQSAYPAAVASRSFRGSRGTGAILLLFACLGFLIYFIDHLAHSIQLDTIMDVVQQNTSLVIADLPDTGETGALAVPAQAVPILAWRSGYIQSVHPEDLYEAAKATQ